MISYVSVLELKLQALSYKLKDTMECFHCGKTTIFGRSHTHHRGVAGGRWKKRAPKTQKIFKPNLQKIAIMLKGKSETVRLCTKCIKRIRKDMTDGVKPFYMLAQTQTKANVTQTAVAVATT